MTKTATTTVTYSPIGQTGGYDTYSSLTDILSEGFANSTVVEVDDGFAVVTTTIGELSGNTYADDTTSAATIAAADNYPAMHEVTSPTVYVRGTATHRGTTASLTAGDQVLTTVYVFRDGRTCITYATSKTDSIIRTVAGTTSDTTRGSRRATRRYNVQFTDGTEVPNLASVQSWHVVTS